ncbi:DNA-binding response regulator [Bacillus sp. J14TS2]|uniref:response regulator transcription factor n=1 Tax=Bacillus sp. J14TS2 TaxID=2807188 RepID=UPI001B20564A|nr:response regulator transcription factor [Bacillus sp. J14TS2]GIN70297.1 DNA-binding response regulator [Bacillus sp. J14TS2]
MKIFIVEDDAVIAKKIKEHIEKWGYEGSVVEDFQNVFSEIIAFDPQLVLMDISLPFFNGYYWCGEIRKVSKIPIIFISSASDNLNIVRAVEMGADDYITKPFDWEVLMAKIHAILRRTYDFSGGSNLMEHQGLIFNVNNFTLSFEGKTEELTKNEAKVFQKLIENRGKIIKREKLMMTLWESDSFVDDSALYTNVNRLRRKLDQMGLENFIKTKKGEGYIIEG